MTAGSFKKDQWISIAAIAAAAGTVLSLLFELRFAYPALISLALFAGLGAMTLGRTDKPRNGTRAPLLIPAALMFSVWVAMTVLFGGFEFTAILYHLKYGFASGGMTGGQMTIVALIVGSLALVAYFWGKLINLNRRMRLLDRALCLPLLFLNPASVEIAKSYAAARYEGIPLHEEYALPVTERAANRTKPDLIQIYMESHELTFAQHKEFGETMRPLDAFRDRGLFATDVNQVEATTWTVAGQIASQCGIPALFEISLGEDGKGGRFLPGARCLGDILSADGYSLAYFGGAQLEFGSKGDFFASHGYGELNGARALFPRYKDHLNFWGVDDDAVLDAAYRRIAQTARNGRPDATVIMTLSGHGPSGVSSKPCVEGTVKVTEADPTLRAMQCTNLLIAGFLARLEREGFLENTLVVLQSDHLSRKTSADHLLRGKDRNNYIAILGPEVEPQTIDRPATMMDIYPTLLEALGYVLPDGKAGLGVSLLSAEHNLMERFGEDEVNRSIKGDIELRRALWHAEPPGLTASAARFSPSGHQ